VCVETIEEEEERESVVCVIDRIEENDGKGIRLKAEREREREREEGERDCVYVCVI
jgi:hypothetical protein